MYSRIARCREHDVDPRTYLRDVLLRVGSETDIAKLTPHGWKKHFEAEVGARKQRSPPRRHLTLIPLQSHPQEEGRTDAHRLVPFARFDSPPQPLPRGSQSPPARLARS